MNKFTREERYTVLKITDVGQALDADECETLIHLEQKVAAWRENNGKAPLVAVVVEKDWPEYEPTWRAIEARMTGAPAPLGDAAIDLLRGLDTDHRVRFYEHDFYVLSNFSAFAIEFPLTTHSGHSRRVIFPTSEHLYHYLKFEGGDADREVAGLILAARSAHDAFKIAESQKTFRRSDWDSVKVGIMKVILQMKAEQHEYVRRKLLATGDRELVEDSWRDDFWGWGPNRDGKNMLGKLWMEVRAELRTEVSR